MKRLLSLILLLSTSIAHAQQLSPAPSQSGRTKMNFDLQRKLMSADLNREIAVFVKGDPMEIKKRTEALGGTYKYAAGTISAIRLPLNKLDDLASTAKITRIESNDLKLQPLNDQMVRMNHVLEVQNGFNLPQGYDGSGVVMGIIDEGIDWTHPDFRDEFGKTRIKYLWDQAIINTNPATQPQPYGYGKEFVGAQIDTSTQHGDSPFSHGTHVTGIAAGNGNALNNYKGVAPKSDLVIVKMDLTRSDNEFLTSLVDAVKYIFDRASQLGEPAVINISLGTYFGSHDAKDIQAQAIESLITDSVSRVVVCAAGNLGNAPIHLGYDITADTSFTWLSQSSSAIYIQAWGDSGNFEGARFALGLQRRKNNSFSDVLQTNLISTTSNVGTIVTDTLFSGTNRVGLVQRLVQNWGGRYSVEYLIVSDSNVVRTTSDTITYLWKFITTGSGHLDAWSFDMVFDNLPSQSVLPSIQYYKTPDINQNIVSSFTCSDKVITVGSHTNRNYYTNANFAITRDTNLVPGQISVFSSRGPTRDGRIKPDLTATGEWLLSCGTQAELNILSAVEPQKVAAGRKHKRSSGTSMSSPVVAGIAALYLQKNPGADWQEVKNKLINCTDKDNFTGTSLPDNRWGYGKVNAYATVKGCTVGFNDLYAYQWIDFSISPNPASESTYIQYDLNAGLLTSKNAGYKITDITGKTLLDGQFQSLTGSQYVSTATFEKGIYICHLLIDGKTVAQKKFVVM